MNIFFQDINDQRSYLFKRINKIFNNFKTGGDYYRDFLKQSINTESIMLDAGCGSGGIISEFKDIPKEIIGADINPELLTANKTVDKKILSDLSKIPIDNESLDIVVIQFVLEHLKRPSVVFEEFQRVLKKDGKLIIYTPNLYNPIMII